MNVRVVRRLALGWLATIAFGALASSPAEAEVLVDGVPLPSDAAVTENTGHSDIIRRFSGAWVGSWGDTLKHILVVEGISDQGEADVIYAIGDLASAGIVRSWKRYKATVSEDTLTISSGFTATYRAVGNTLRAGFERGNTIPSRAIMSKVDIATLLTSGERVTWSKRQVEFLNTDLVENGRPVQLEVVLFKPEGEGPFPLVVFNHGSTGSGTLPERFTRTSWNFGLAEFFLDKGWMIAFPQRRGRGRSDGLYDEGFAPLRANGYSCDPTRSLPGADRALGDIEAAVRALLHRPDVSRRTILMGGNSRGGILSVAYAGIHSEQILGVINFVGGWISERCGYADQINQTLFQRGASFGRPTLWLYGSHDKYYSIAHSRSNFEAYRRAGGKGAFVEFDAGVIDGHDLIANPSLWKSALGEYLDSIRK